jgi:hypothetical protein
MAERRFFFFSGNADDAFKDAARKSLMDAKWMPVQEFLSSANRRTGNQIPTQTATAPLGSRRGDTVESPA